MSTTTLTLIVKAKSDKALLLVDEDTGIEDWVPVSQMIDVDDTDYIGVGEIMDFEIKNWILEKNGFI